MLTGAVLLSEFRNYSLEQFLLTCLGTLICVIGLYFKIFTRPSGMMTQAQSKYMC